MIFRANKMSWLCTCDGCGRELCWSTYENISKNRVSAAELNRGILSTDYPKRPIIVYDTSKFSRKYELCEDCLKRIIALTTEAAKRYKENMAQIESSFFKNYQAQKTMDKL